ncbi:hypothetical protein P308_07530 [Pseudomonas piscis]|nr:hypothetical protein P308_07530 [Pseudomonas piscis]
MQLEAVAVLVLRRDRDDHRRTPCHPRLANDGKVVPILEFLRIQRTRYGVGRISQPRHQRATDTLGATIDTHYLLSGPIELDQTLENLSILDTMPDVMGRETTVTLVNEGALEALLLFRLPKTLQPVLGFVGVGWNHKPATEQKRE